MPKGRTDMTIIFGSEGTDGRLLSHPLLAKTLESVWGCDAECRLERSPRGKPYFADMPNRWLSLSHSGRYALCALSDEGEVGVDVEVIRTHRPGLPEYVLTPEEKAQFDGSWEDFTRLWTLKESWCKMKDIPLYPPSQVSMPKGCSYRSYTGPDWWAAICCEGVPPEEILWINL